MCNLFVIFSGFPSDLIKTACHSLYHKPIHLFKSPTCWPDLRFNNDWMTHIMPCDVQSYSWALEITKVSCSVFPVNDILP